MTSATRFSACATGDTINRRKEKRTTRSNTIRLLKTTPIRVYLPTYPLRASRYSPKFYRSAQA
jgi:hypothetical protein